MSTFLRNRTISKTTPKDGKKTPSPNSMLLPTNAQGSGFLLNTQQHWYVLLDWNGQSRRFAKFIFHAWFLRALWVKSSGHTLRFSRTKRTFPSSRLARKREFHPLRFDQQITHETFAEFSERVTRQLNNFPIAEIVNGKLKIKKIIKKKKNSQRASTCNE